MKLKELLAVASIGMANGFGGPSNTDYTQQCDKRRAEHEAAVEKKRLVREQIRARRAAKEQRP